MATQDQINNQKSDDDANRSFSRDLISHFKVWNRLDNDPSINIYQSLSAHSAMRAVSFSLNTPYGSKNYTVDVINLVMSGDVETAYVALKKMAVQDRADGDWLNQDSIDYLVDAIALHIGPSVQAQLDAVIDA